MADLKSVSLSDENWQKIIRFIAGSVVWSEANPILMEIGQQLQRQSIGQQPVPQNSGKREIPDVQSH